MRAGGPRGWWERVIGPGKALDPARYRLLCFNLLGSCYGASGPADVGFPRRTDDRRFPAPPPAPKGDLTLPEDEMPATITTWDHARSILLALDALGVRRVHLAVGGSLGAMIVMCLAALAPHRFARIVPIGAAEKATSWIIAWNHVQRQAILLDPHFPEEPRRGLELARQIGMITYRAEEGLELNQGRRMVGGSDDDPPWSSRAHYRVHTYLEHQGQKLVGRFDSRSYLALLGAMDHHDLARKPIWSAEKPIANESEGSWGERQIRASALCVGIRTDELFFPATIRAFADRLRRQGVTCEFEMLDTPHGHDGFLIEAEKMDAILARALRLPEPR
jgi:homoserine O-acetyltransferase